MGDTTEQEKEVPNTQLRASNEPGLEWTVITDSMGTTAVWEQWRPSFGDIRSQQFNHPTDIYEAPTTVVLDSL